MNPETRRHRIITSEANLHRKLAEAPYVAYATPEGSYVGSGYVEIDTARMAFVVQADDTRLFVKLSASLFENAVTLCSTEADAVMLLAERALDSQGAQHYCMISHGRSRVSFAIGAVARTTLVIAVFNGEDLGYFAQLAGYATHEPRLSVIWKHEPTVAQEFIDYILDRIAERAFFVADDLTIEVESDRFDVCDTSARLPAIDGLSLDLSGFRRQLGPNARNT